MTDGLKVLSKAVRTLPELIRALLGEAPAAASPVPQLDAEREEKLEALGYIE